MSYATIALSVANGVAELTLNRPQSLNSLNKTLIDEVRLALDLLEKDDSVRCLILTGAGRGFCAGADLADSGFSNEEGRSVGQQTAHSMLIGFNPMGRELAKFPKPVVVAVNQMRRGRRVAALADHLGVHEADARFDARVAARRVVDPAALQLDA